MARLLWKVTIEKTIVVGAYVAQIDETFQPLGEDMIGPHSSLAYALFCGATISLCHLVWFVIVSIGLSQKAARAWVLGHAIIFNRVIGAALLCIAGSLLFISEA